MVAAAGGVQDSGFAWVVCAACFLIQVMMAAFLHTSGMFYIMFKDGLDASDSALSLITSLNICVIFLMCAVTGALTDRYGERLISLCGAFLSTVALACCSFSTQVYHLYILYGVAAGIGLGMTYNSSLSIIPQYFDKYMRVATCITLCGPGVGSFIFPPIINALENQFGWRGVILIIAGLNAQTLVCCCLFRPAPANSKGMTLTEDLDFIKSEKVCEHYQICQGKKPCEVRVRPRDTEFEVDSKFLSNAKVSTQKSSFNTTDEGYKYVVANTQQENRIDTSEGHLEAVEDMTIREKGLTSEKISILSLFKNRTFLCVLGLRLFINFPVSIVGTHFGSYVLTLGYNRADVVLMYMVWGISSTISRLMVGIFAQVTRTNTGLLILCSCIVNGVFTIVLPHMTQSWLLYIFATQHQALLSFYCLLSITILVESVHSRQSSIAIGLTIGFCTPGVAIGPPMAAWLYESTKGYSSSFYLSGVLLIMAGLTMGLPAYSFDKLGKTN